MNSPTAPLVLITSIPREIRTPLPDLMPNATVNQRLARLVASAGGIPVGADAWSDPAALLARVDAVVINGGIDLDPSAYGADRHVETDPPQPERDAFELAVARTALETGLPVLGICRGMHILNVIRGGTLIQHLPDVSDLEHYDNDRYAVPVHDVATVEGSRVRRALGEAARVNSIHHQAIDRLGQGLEVAARADDGTIEAIEDPSAGIVGVQWHPEFLASHLAEAHVDLFRMDRAGQPAETMS
jgi:putative glutamine amidotransferase